MNVERLEFVCVNAMKEQSIVKIDLGTLKVESKGEQVRMDDKLLTMSNLYLDLLNEVIMQNNADRCQYNQILASLAKTIVCYVLQVQFCDWMVIDKVTPKINMNIEKID